jgi:hypothetical protein
MSIKNIHTLFVHRLENNRFQNPNLDLKKKSIGQNKEYMPPLFPIIDLPASI